MESIVQRAAIDVTSYLRPKEKKQLVFLLGFASEEGSGKFKKSSNYFISIGKKQIIYIYGHRTDTLQPSILFVNLSDDIFWLEDLEGSGHAYDIKVAFEKHFTGNYDDFFNTPLNNGKHFYCDDVGDNIMITPTNLRIRCKYGKYIFMGDALFFDNTDLHITKYISYDCSRDNGIKKVMEKMGKGIRLNGKDLRKLLLEPIRDLDSCGEFNMFLYKCCSLYTNKFIFDCRDDQSVCITVNGRKYLITATDRCFNEIYINRLLLAVKEGNLEEVIINQYPSVFFRTLKE